MKIKVCGLKESNNMNQLIKTVKPDYAGLIFFPESRRYVASSLKPGFIKDIKDKTNLTGVFVNATIQTIEKNCSTYGVNTVQLHGEESPSFCEKVRSLNLSVIKSFRISQNFTFKIMKDYIGSCDYFLFDTYDKLKGGTGKKFNWQLLNHYNFPKPFFISGGIGPADAGRIKNINHPSLYGVDINSRFEKEQGIKNIEKVQSFINQLK